MLHKILTAALLPFTNTKSVEQQQLDKFIASKNPSTPAEVDYLIREYDRKQSTTGWIL